MDYIIYCEKQGISFRGHRDDATTDASSNRGNFIALLEFRAKTDSVLANFIEKAPKNARYTSKTIQNELIDVSGVYIREHTCLTSNRGKFFSIIADEVTDSSNNHTVLGVCHRIPDYNNVHNPVIKEVFYDFVQLERTNSEKVCEKLIECHTSRSIDFNKVRAQIYDTTSSMSPAVGGLHGRFKALYQKAMYLPCNVHILNLELQNATNKKRYRCYE